MNWTGPSKTTFVSRSAGIRSSREANIRLRSWTREFDKIGRIVLPALARENASVRAKARVTARIFRACRPVQQSSFLFTLRSPAHRSEGRAGDKSRTKATTAHTKAAADLTAREAALFLVQQPGEPVPPSSQREARSSIEQSSVRSNDSSSSSVRTASQPGTSSSVKVRNLFAYSNLQLH